MNEKLAKVMFHKDDFGVCRAALVHSEMYWKDAIEDPELRPDGWSAEDCENILTNILNVKEKIDIVLGMDYNDISQETMNMIQRDIEGKGE